MRTVTTLGTFALTALAIYALVVATMYLAQRSLLFQPTVLGRGFMATQLLERGFRVVLAEYPGYGPRSGGPSQHAMVDDGARLCDAVARTYPSDTLVLVGESLGTAVVGQRLTRPLARAPGRVVLITPFVSAVETAARIYPWLPVRWLARDPLEVLPGVTRYAGPAHVLIAGADEVVGAAQGRSVAEAARSRGPTTVVELHGAHHNDWVAHADGSVWDRLLGRTRRDEPP